MNARRFLFDTDFRPRPDNPATVKEAAALAETVARAEAEGYARGLREGQVMAEQQIQARLSDALTRLGLAAAGLIGQSDARDQAREDEALDFAILLARKVAGEALDAQPLAAIGDAARAALQHLRGVPHLVVRVHESLVDDSEALVKRLARERGFEGRLVVLGEPDLAPGDARMEWADGGVVRDRAQIEAAVLAALGIPA
ncbi:flagellar assembly protein FliH [Methylobacterium sp. Leaf104]|uniref:FliH/SctL family protein n=1 Tax=Methylobacterium TaxID=407 RepID=UPI0006F962C4|nr:MULTISPECIES: FliH/SctL family protein [Methylobacterium]KQP31772.1 flagellar assembly protein FliH [Methylobacterium sp. Leaf104]MCI9880695.1 flagellar assembly protein FliH [Methylobacterium goesingense]